MLLLWLYWTLLLCCCGYAVARGGPSGRWGAVIIAGGSLLSLVVAMVDDRWKAPLYMLFWVDAGCTAALFCLALRSSRYWPIWSASFQLTSTLVHLARILSPGASPKFYQAFQTVWSVPMLVAMALGIFLDHHRGL